jgi:predicted metal-dependent phosphoesterase TrpH
LIDLHTHTTASDGRCAPAELVARAAAAGVSVLSVTDHDTVGGCDLAAAACETSGLTLVPGIEITAVEDGIDVHVLGYFIDRQSPALHTFLAEQRRRRVARVREMIERLREFGIQLDGDTILRPGIDDATRSVGRPWIARALVAGGHVADTNEAFDRWLSRGRPAFVPRLAARPAEVFARIHEARGLASVAHPGLLARDEWLPVFARAGVDALEAYHTDHDGSQTAHYVALAAQLRLAVTGGSDYHGDESHGGAAPGSTSLPRDAYDRLVQLRQ